VTITTTGQLLLTRREAAAALGVSVDTIAHLIQSGELRGVRIGKSVRVPQHELNALIERGQARTKA
jgi:excisionase family DNA binding protein